MYSRVALLLAFGLLSSLVVHHAAQEIGESPEYAAVYGLDGGVYTLNIERGEDGTFAEETFAFMLTPVEDGEDLDAVIEETEEVWTETDHGEVEPIMLHDEDLAVPSLSSVYVVDLNSFTSSSALTKVVAPTEGNYAILMQHDPDEVGAALTSSTGSVILPTSEESVHGDEHGDEEDEELSDSEIWGNALAAGIIISALGALGILIVMCIKKSGKDIQTLDAFIFSGGALITTAAVHIVPEAQASLSESIQGIEAVGKMAGIILMCGVFTGLVTHVLVSHSYHGHHLKEDDGPPSASPPEQSTSAADPSMSNAMEHNAKNGDQLEKNGPKEGTGSNNRKLLDFSGLSPICWNIIIGDIVHNFADGLIIGFSFLLCSLSMGWTVTIATLIHEAPQEIVDFLALVHGGMSMTQAFVFNLLSSLPALLGVIIVLAVKDQITSEHLGVVLLLGAGIFVWVALAELLPAGLTDRAPGRKGQLRAVVAFMLGCLLLGIPLIFDQHCEAGGHAHHHH
ncbi:unnamed protein product [Discosporangium mesarthrocarpum]